MVLIAKEKTKTWPLGRTKAICLLEPLSCLPFSGWGEEMGKAPMYKADETTLFFWPDLSQAPNSIMIIFTSYVVPSSWATPGHWVFHMEAPEIMLQRQTISLNSWPTGSVSILKCCFKLPCLGIICDCSNSWWTTNVDLLTHFWVVLGSAYYFNCLLRYSAGSTQFFTEFPVWQRCAALRWSLPTPATYFSLTLWTNEVAENCHLLDIPPQSSFCFCLHKWHSSSCDLWLPQWNKPPPVSTSLLPIVHLGNGSVSAKMEKKHWLGTAEVECGRGIHNSFLGGS